MATSYSNPGGNGDRTATITVTGNFTPQGTLSNAVDGASGNNGTDSFGFESAQTTGNIITFDFGAGNPNKIIDELTWVQQTTTAQGTWSWSWSTDGSAFTVLDTGLVIAGASSTTVLTLSVYAPGARYYRLTQTAGTTSGSPWIQEVTFKIDDVALPTLSAVVSQSMDVFAQVATGQLERRLMVASQTINDFTVGQGAIANFVHRGHSRPKVNTIQVGGRSRRVR